MSSRCLSLLVFSFISTILSATFSTLDACSLTAVELMLALSCRQHSVNRAVALSTSVPSIDCISHHRCTDCPRMKQILRSYFPNGRLFIEAPPHPPHPTLYVNIVFEA